MKRRRHHLVVAALLGLVGAAGCGDETAAESCIEELLPHVPGELGVPLEGADLERARAAGLDDSGEPLDVLIAAMEAGLLLDPVSRGSWRTLSDPVFSFGDVQCWLGHGRGFAAIGSFDPEAVAEFGGLSDGRLLVIDDEGDPTAAFEGREPVVLMPELLSEANDAEMVSFIANSWSGEPVTAVGIGSIEDGPRYVVRWVFGSDPAAEEAQPEIERLLAESVLLPHAVGEVDAAALTRDGSTLSFDMPLLEDAEPSVWKAPSQRLDPALIYGWEY